MKYYLYQLAERHDCLLQRLLMLGEKEKIGGLELGSDGIFEGFWNHSDFFRPYLFASARVSSPAAS